MTFPVTHIGISIGCTAEKAYEYAANPMNLPAWATGLSGSVVRDGKTWIAESPMGSITIRFADTNAFGVLDHDVTLSNGQTFSNPMRVFRNGDGCEVTFALYRQPEMTDEAFLKDAATIRSDVEKLKQILES